MALPTEALLQRRPKLLDGVELGVTLWEHLVEVPEGDEELLQGRGLSLEVRLGGEQVLAAALLLRACVGGFPLAVPLRRRPAAKVPTLPEDDLVPLNRPGAVGGSPKEGLPGLSGSCIDCGTRVAPLSARNQPSTIFGRQDLGAQEGASSSPASTAPGALMPPEPLLTPAGAPARREGSTSGWCCCRR